MAPTPDFAAASGARLKHNIFLLRITDICYGYNTSLSNIFDRNKTSMKLTLYQNFAGNRYKNMIKQLSKSELDFRVQIFAKFQNILPAYLLLLLQMCMVCSKYTRLLEACGYILSNVDYSNGILK